ncbi:MAG: toll/interleukin-1 receptor domain-containing protein, partial [Oscillospiraceae bacterium]|nr:toll/interleukin-1 receptor domain-containing protein [Oscillospiraceae bacterium]
MNKKPNIFISYRRSGGEDFAGRLFSDLRHDGYDLSFDVETFRPGKFNKQIYYHINKCNAVILILPPNALDRCVNEGDWLRLEIAHALKKKKLIIPIMLRGFTWPDELPKDIDDVRYYHGLTYESSLYSEIYKKLLGLLDKAFSSKTGPKPAPDEVKVDTVSKKSHSRGNDTGKTLDPTPKSKDKPFPWIEFSPLCKEILSFLLKYFLLPILIATIGFLLLFSADLMLSFWLFPSLLELINQYISVDFDTFLSLMEKVNPCLFLPIWILCNLI